MFLICFYLKWIKPGWARIPLEVGPEAEVLQICLGQGIIWFVMPGVEPPRERDSSPRGLHIGVCCRIWSSVKESRPAEVEEKEKGGEWGAWRGHSHSPSAVWPHWELLENCVCSKQLEAPCSVLSRTVVWQAWHLDKVMRLHLCKLGDKNGKCEISWKASWIIQEKDSRYPWRWSDSEYLIKFG